MKEVNYKIPFKGKHCESTSIGVLLSNINVTLSEEMIFGLGEGLNFAILPWGSDNFPFLGGRVKQGELITRLSNNINLELDIQTTSSENKAFNNLVQCLDKNKPVYLQLDCFHLEHFTNKIHFRGHVLSVVGYNEKEFLIVDTHTQGGLVRCSKDNIKLARSDKGPMFGKNLSITILNNKDFDIVNSIYKAVRNNANDFLNPPITNFGYKGLLRASKDIFKWFKDSVDIKKEFSFAASMMENAGTGGNIFRNMYTDFLKESFEITNNDSIREASILFNNSRNKWSKIINNFNKIASKNDISLVEECSKLFVEIEVLETKAMILLSNI